jgi:aspartyl protease family protein
MLKRTRCLLLLILSMNVFAVDKITVSGLFNGKAIVTIDGKQRFLKVGKPSPEGVLLISANAREAVIEIDGEQNTYTLGQHIGSHYKKPVGGNTVSIAPDRGGMYEVNGSINGFLVKFVVDTGATLVSMNGNDAKRIGIDYKTKGIKSQTETASGVVASYVVTLKTIMVDSIKLHDVKGLVIEGNYPTTILLGNSFLEGVNMNREGRMLLLKER